jgi:hypothetical protein
MNRARSRLAQLALLGPAVLVALGATPDAAPPQAPDASGDAAVAAQRAFCRPPTAGSGGCGSTSQKISSSTTLQGPARRDALIGDEEGDGAGEGGVW